MELTVIREIIWFWRLCYTYICMDARRVLGGSLSLCRDVSMYAILLIVGEVESLSILLRTSY